ncbi:hypothetical protein BST12_25825 [Mycobacterium angelicum]|uniref:Uncharacterized protein n=1 Tax=Mycobacterium angelicum TaxID=470074 RepID=A0A1W9ZCK3_MYCAN|nr:hypothetical protein BST12_25825 [Mycobacterium angelicum]
MAPAPAPAPAPGPATGCPGPAKGCAGAADATAGPATAAASEIPAAHRTPADKVRILGISNSLRVSAGALGSGDGGVDALTNLSCVVDNLKLSRGSHSVNYG